MSTSKTHTPGPWSVDESGCDVLTPDGWRIARMDLTDQGEADARLVAAAPDLLAACRAALQDFGSLPARVGAASSRLIAEAIAKAEGDG